MALTSVNRARIILDLLKDGIVTTEANYGAGIDKAPALVASKYVDAFLIESQAKFLDANGDPRAPTNEELADVFLRRMRQYVTGTYVHIKQQASAETARQAAIAAAETETLAEIGE